MRGRIFVIGASQGGIQAVSALIAQLPASFPAPLFVAQHIAASSLGGLPRILGRAGCLPAAHPRNMEIIQGGRVYVAPPDMHMLVQHGYVWLSRGPRENHVRPAIDPLFRSAASAYGAAVVGVVLTGHLDDGTAGLMAVKDRGGIAIVQDHAEAVAPSMPRSAQAHVCIDHCCTLSEMGAILVNLANDDVGSQVRDVNPLIEIETRIAAGELNLADWSQFEKRSVPSGLNCPDCSNVLFEVRDDRMIRFRCRAGHAFSARCLLEEQARTREKTIAGLYGSFVGEATLASRLLGSTVLDDPGLRAAFSDQVSEASRKATQVGQWLNSSAEGGNAMGAVPGATRTQPDIEPAGIEDSVIPRCW
ncbi:chemotaxis protein CheB [Paraburkholderia azotifigens]|uniref:protein-glutamate methylesterase n=1 Tax=Paraburkholderia azotifigens TaxID=2057004 RepID=A0ABU9R2W6_9BURK